MKTERPNHHLQLVAGTDVNPQPTAVVFANTAASEKTPARHVVRFSAKPEQSVLLNVLLRIYYGRKIFRFSAQHAQLLEYVDREKTWWIFSFEGYADLPTILCAALRAEGFNSFVQLQEWGWEGGGPPGVKVLEFRLWP